MARFLLTLQYLGTRYAGWQTQKNGLGIQQVVESALTRLCHATVRVEGAGRTDGGVHALAQRAHADIPMGIDARGVLLGVNALLPADIRVTAVEEVSDNFHARFEPAGKTYRYQIWNVPVADVFHHQTHYWVAGGLDEARMSEAAVALLGHHDFAAFTVAAPEVSSTWRTVESISVNRLGSRVVIEVAADGFLRFMVRRIAGSLIEVGRGKLEAGALADSLEPAFAPARWTAPAKGLTLVEVRYAGA
jgi:tRNA pseudouridine38-40 synthase